MWAIKTHKINGKETYNAKMPEHISIGAFSILLCAVAISLAIWQTLNAIYTQYGQLV